MLATAVTTEASAARGGPSGRSFEVRRPMFASPVRWPVGSHGCDPGMKRDLIRGQGVQGLVTMFCEFTGGRMDYH